MTTTYDAELTDDTIAAAYYDDPDTYTIAEAWMSSPLGQLDDDITETYALSDFTDDRDRVGSRAKLFAAVAAGIIGGATLGAVLFGYRPVTAPTVVVPGFGVSTEQLPAAPTPTADQQGPAKDGVPAPAMPSAPPKPGAAEAKTNEEVAAVPDAPPVAPPPVVIDVYIPPLGDKPAPPDPEPPKPQPPGFDPPDIDAVAVPEDEPDPEPPNDVVIEAPIIDPSLKKPTTNDLKPVESSRFTAKLPTDNQQDAPQRKLNSGRMNSIAKP